MNDKDILMYRINAIDEEIGTIRQNINRLEKKLTETTEGKRQVILQRIALLQEFKKSLGTQKNYARIAMKK